MRKRQKSRNNPFEWILLGVAIALLYLLLTGQFPKADPPTPEWVEGEVQG